MMGYLYKDISYVKSRCGSTIPCNYLEHSRFKFSCDFCAGLHYLFVSFAPERIYSKVYEIRTAIRYLLSFAEEYESQPVGQLCLTSLNDLTAESFRQFALYCNREKAPKNIPSRLKGAFESVAKSTNDGMPLLTLPMTKQADSIPNEPLSGEGFEDFSQALKEHINMLKEKLSFRKRVEDAIPYSLNEINQLMKTSPGPDWYWEPSDERALKPLLIHKHPLSVPLEEYITISRDFPDYASEEVHAIYRRYGSASHRHIDEKALRATFSLERLFNKFFPNSVVQAAIVMFLMLQTGWNKETVLALDVNNYLYAVAEMLSSDLA